MSLLTPMLRTSPLTDWFSDVQRVQGMLDFEAALVRAEVECGLVPQTALNPIIESCRHEKIDFSALGQAAASAGNLAIPLVKQLTARVKERNEAAARYVHWGPPARMLSIPVLFYSCAARWRKRNLCYSVCSTP